MVAGSNANAGVGNGSKVTIPVADTASCYYSHIFLNLKTTILNTGNEISNSYIETWIVNLILLISTETGK